MADTNQEVLVKLSAIDNLTPVMVKALQAMQDNSAKMVEALDKVSDGQEKAGTSAEHSSESNEHAALSFIALKEAAEVVYEAFEKVEQQFDKAIEEALAGEQATNRLNGALVATGQYTPEVSEEMTKFAESLNKLSGANIETVKNLEATGVQMGLSTEKAQEMVIAAQKLAAATGQDLQSAFQLLSGSLTGQSRGLARVLPQVKDLTQAQLMHGDAIDLVNGMLTAQYELYQGSFAASLDKAKTSVNEVYKEIGNLIINSPIVKAAMQEFADIMLQVAAGVKSVGEYLNEHQQDIVNFGTALGKVALIAGTVTAAYIAMTTVIPFLAAVYGALTTSVGLYGVAGTIAANATAALDAGLALLAAPVTIAIIAIVALTAALYKWPGLFDVLVGGIKTLLGVAIFPMTAALAAMTIGIGGIVSIFNKDWGNAITNAGKSLIDMNVSLVKNGYNQAAMGVASVAAGKQVQDSAAKSKQATEDALKKQSELNAAKLNEQKMYDGFTYGTLKMRQELAAQVSDRDKSFKDFETYLDAREKLAVSKAADEAMQVNAVRNKALGGAQGAGSAGVEAEAQVAIDAETRKQAAIQVLRQKGILDDEQYESALMMSQQRSDTAKLRQAQASQAQLDSILGLTPAAQASKLALLEQSQALQLQQMRTQANAEGATAEQIAAQEQRLRQQFFQQRVNAQKQFNTQEVQLATAQQKHLADLQGNSPQGQQAKLQLMQRQFQMELQQRKAEGQQAGLSEKQIDAAVEAQNQTNLAAMKKQKEQFIEEDMQQNETLGNNWQVSLDQIALAQEKFGTVMGTLRGVQQTEEYKGVMGALDNLASLRNSKNKSAFEVGKAAAIAGTAIHTGEAAMSAYASLAAIPFVGPVLGAAAAAAAVAAGVVQIQQIQSQQFNPGGQADSGMDQIPQQLSGKSFILSQGERVVQPTANKDLTDFLAKNKSATGPSAGGGSGIMITLNYKGAMTKDDVSDMADLLIQEIRKRSNNGQPIMNAKGLVNS